MSCRGCDDKTRGRYRNVGKTVKESIPNVDNVAEANVPTKGFTPQSPSAQASEEEFYSDIVLTYDEIVERNEAQRTLLKAEGEKAMRKMTTAMRRVYVEQLVGVANGDLVTLGSMSMHQAIIVLHDLLKRDDFQDVRDMYPRLKDQVDLKYGEIVGAPIVLE